MVGSWQQVGCASARPQLSHLSPQVATSASTTASASAPAFSFTPPGRNHLYVPGPVNIHEDVQRAMSVPGAALAGAASASDDVVTQGAGLALLH